MEWIDLGYAGLFAISFLAATVLPFSSEVVFLIFLQKGFDPVTSYCMATAGNFLGGSTNIWLGRFGRKLVSKRAKKFWSEEKIAKYGAWLAFFSWVPFVGDPLLILLGMYRTPLVLTHATMFFGKALRYAVILYFWSLQ